MRGSTLGRTGAAGAPAKGPNGRFVKGDLIAYYRDVAEVLVRTTRHHVSRAVREGDGLRVLLKAQVPPARGAGLEQEFEFTRRLPLGSVPRPLEITRQTGLLWLVPTRPCSARRQGAERSRR